MKTIMDRDHELWGVFCYDLECAVFGVKGECYCAETTNITRSILSEYLGIDVEATLEAFEQLGGFCDCEIIYNCMED